MIDEERPPRRLRLARAALKVAWDTRTVSRLAHGLAGRRHARRILRWAGAGALAAAIAGLALWLPVQASSRATREAGPARQRALAGLAAQDGRDRLAAAREAEAPPLVDLAADPLEAGQRWAAFLGSPHSDPVIPDVSEVGHRPRGDEPVPGAQVDVRSAPFGARGDGVSDDTDAIQRAIDSVEESGGVVYFPDGEYLVSDILYVRGNGTVLRGQHRRGARLVFRRPLDETVGPNVVGPLSRWRWAGGLVWFHPRSRPPHGGPGKPLGEGWPAGDPVASLSVAAARGDRTLTAAQPVPLLPGDLIFVVVQLSPDLAATGWRAERDNGHPSAGGVTPVRGATLRWPVEVAAVDGRTVTLAQPLRFDLPLELHPHLHAARPDSVIRDVGVEHLGLVMRRRVAAPVEPVGWNGVFFQNALHAFARDLTVIDCDVAVASSAAKNLSLTDLEVVARALPPDRPIHRAVALRSWSHDVLVERVDIASPWLGLTLEGTGFVLSGVHGRLNRVGGFAVDVLFTDISHQPAAREPPEVMAVRGQRVVGWNVRVEGQPDPQLPDNLPANLYEAQKEARLASEEP